MDAPPADAVIDAEEAETVLDLMWELRQSTILWGPPGIAKSALVWQLTKRKKVPLLDIRATTRNPVDINGLPYVLFENGSKPPSKEPTATDRVGYTVWSRPDIIQQHGEGVIFLDELAQGGPEVQGGLYQLVQDRCIGPHKLGDGWRIFAASNRVSDRGNVWPMLSPLADRLQHYNLKVAMQPWLKWAIDPENAIHPLIIGYLRLRAGYEIEQHDLQGKPRGQDNPDPFAPRVVAGATPTHRMAAPTMPTRLEIPDQCGMLLRFMPQERSFPTPRSWEKVSNSLYLIEEKGLAGSNIEFATIAGKVGRVAATELLAYCRLFRQGFSIEKMIRDPNGAPVPQDPGMRLAVTTALARHATKANIRAITTYAERALPEEHRVMLIDDAERGNPDVVVTDAFQRWAVKYQDVRGATTV